MDLEIGAAIEVESVPMNLRQYTPSTSEEDNSEFNLLSEKAVEILEEKLTSKDVTALMRAAESGDLNDVLAEVSKGGKPEAKTMAKLTLLHFAAVNKTHGLDIISYFINDLSLSAADVNDEQPVHYALRVDNYELALSLFPANAAGMSNLFHYFILRDELPFAEHVLSKDRSLLISTDPSGRNALQIAAESCSEMACRWLCTLGLRLSCLNRERQSLLHLAAKNRVFGHVDFFADKGLHLERRDANGWTPFCVAILERTVPNLLAAKRLLALGARSSVRICFRNLLHLCAERNRLRAAKFVHGNNPELIKEVCEGGWTALHIAAEKGNLRFCRWLVEAGAEADVRDRTNRLPLDLVPGPGNASLRNFLSNAKENAETSRLSFLNYDP